MNERQKRITAIKLLDLTRQAYQRHKIIAEHLGEHFGIDYDVFVPDPLFDYAVSFLRNVIQDQKLLFWWLEHCPNCCVYSPKDDLRGYEIQTARQLWDYYQATLKSGV